MLKFPLLLTLLLVISLNLRVYAHNKRETKSKDRSAEQYRELELDDLIKSLERRIKNAKEAIDIREAFTTKRPEEAPESTKPQSCGKADIFQPQPRPVNPRDRKFAGDAATTNAVPSRLDKRKISQNLGGIDELHREAYQSQGRVSDGFVSYKDLSDFERDEQYYRSLLRLQRLYRLYNKRYLAEGRKKDERTSRHCIGANYVDDKLDHIHSYLEKSRLLADHIADTAVHLLRKKSYLAKHLHGCGKRFDIIEEPVVAVVKEPVIVEEPEIAVVEKPVVTVVEPVVAETKRDVEINSELSSSTSVDAGGVGVAVAKSSDLHVETGTGIGGGITAEVSSDLVSKTALGTGSGLEGHLDIKLGTHKGFLKELNSCENYERKMIMDLAIEEAAQMIRRLGHETRSGLVYRDDPEYNKRILDLAIDFVNKVTSGVTGDLDNKLDLFSGIRYNNAEEYLKSTIFDGGELEPISNAGFDYIRQDLIDGDIPYDLDIYDDYVGRAGPYSRGLCDSCAKLDFKIRNSCPLCKRSGHTYHGRVKRKPSGVPGGRIYHLERSPQVQKKVA